MGLVASDRRDAARRADVQRSSWRFAAGAGDSHYLIAAASRDWCVRIIGSDALSRPSLTSVERSESARQRARRYDEP